MNIRRATFVALALLVSPALAQPPGDGSRIIPNPGGGAGAKLGVPGGAPGAPMPALDPKNNRLDALLMQWEDAMKGIQSIHVKECIRTDKDPTAQKPKVWKGEARYLKPNLAALRLAQVEDPGMVEMMISTGQFLYEYRVQFKKLVIHELPPVDSGFQNNLLSFLFGMSAADAKRRYELTLSKDVSAENQHWIYLDIKPRFEADKREFTKAQLVLYAKTMLPRRLWFLHANSSEVTWDLPVIDIGAQLTPMNFRPGDPPKDWETQKVPLQQPPTAPGSGKAPTYRNASQR